MQTNLTNSSPTNLRKIEINLALLSFWTSSVVQYSEECNFGALFPLPVDIVGGTYSVGSDRLFITD
jgi:hypothetical protein